MEKSLEVQKLSRIVVEKGNVNTLSDAGASALMAKGALEGALLNVKINLKSIEDQTFASELKNKSEFILSESQKLKQEIDTLLQEKL
jgi:formiminotetrahydrofolate cyclodeaminase